MFERLLHTCLRPRVVYNSFGDKIVTSCGKCAYCVNKRGAYFSRLCECESNDNAYTYFATQNRNRESHWNMPATRWCIW